MRSKSNNIHCFLWSFWRETFSNWNHKSRICWLAFRQLEKSCPQRPLYVPGYRSHKNWAPDIMHCYPGVWFQHLWATKVCSDIHHIIIQTAFLYPIDVPLDLLLDESKWMKNLPSTQASCTWIFLHVVLKTRCQSIHIHCCTKTKTSNPRRLILLDT